MVIKSIARSQYFIVMLKNRSLHTKMQLKVNLITKMKQEQKELHKVGELTPVKSPFFSYSSEVLPEAFAYKEKWNSMNKRRGDYHKG